MFGEELVQKARNECHTIIQVGDELGAPVGIALRICRKTIDSYGLPQPGDVLAWITSGKRSDADVKINPLEMARSVINCRASHFEGMTLGMVDFGAAGDDNSISRRSNGIARTPFAAKA